MLTVFLVNPLLDALLQFLGASLGSVGCSAGFSLDLFWEFADVANGSDRQLDLNVSTIDFPIGKRSDC